MKLSDITLLASCAVLVLSQPLEKRVLVIETVYQQVVETVEVTSTYYVQPGEHAPSPSVTSSAFKVRHKHRHTKKSSVTPKPPPVETVTPEVPPSVTPEVPPSVTPEVPPSVTPEVPPSVTPEVPPSVTPEVPPSVTPEVQPSITPEVQPSITPEVNPVVTPEASSAPALQPPPSAAPQEKYEYSFAAQPSEAPQVEKPTALASGGGACGEVGGKCVGDLTYYEAGLGACGTYNDGNTEDVFALAVGMMGDQSNGNPFCGRSATITANGKSVVCKLVDKCMGCEGQSVDLSYHAIDQIMDRSVGRMHDIEWWFND